MYYVHNMNFYQLNLVHWQFIPIEENIKYMYMHMYYTNYTVHVPSLFYSGHKTKSFSQCKMIENCV